MINSIRAKLTLWCTAVLAVVIVSLGSQIYFPFVRALRADTDNTLSAMSNDFIIAAKSEESEHRPSHAAEDISETAEAFRFRDYQFAVVSTTGEVVAATTQFASPNETDCSGEEFVTCAIAGEPYRVLRRPFNVGGHDFSLFTFHPLADRLMLERQLRDAALLAIPITLSLAGVSGYYLVRRSLRPIQEMSARSRNITSRNLHERLPVANEQDELGQLATAFNELLDRLDKSFEQQRRFMADASHELRTPLAIVQGESEVALSKSDRSAADYRGSLEIVHDEGKRLTQIVEDLFILARADSGNFASKVADVYIDEIAADCVRSIRTLAERRHIEIALSAEEMLVRGDESLLRRLILNLLDNAIKYNIEGGRIVIRIGDQTLSVTNTGPEISGHERVQIFERFFRSDKSRKRSDDSFAGGAGLGLSISRWIAQRHGATLELAESANGENTFTVKFPH